MYRRILVHMIDELCLSFDSKVCAGDVEWLDIPKENGMRIIEAGKVIARSAPAERAGKQ